MHQVSPIVYTGLTLSEKDVLKIIPGARVRPPIARGDLYTDRIIGNSLFVIIDGVFQQRESVSPREVIDVATSGAIVVGASSMGALRAAECWPAGVRGIGSIYRLFRRGVLDSDDEVVVAFDPHGRIKPSLALIDVRYSVSRLQKQGELKSNDGAAIIEAAKNIFFMERSWRSILDKARISDREQMEKALSKYALKRKDAFRALHIVGRWMSNGTVAEQNKPVDPMIFSPAEMTREPAYLYPRVQGIEADKPEVLDWFFTSGRYTKYAFDTLSMLVKLNPGYLEIVGAMEPGEAVLSDFYGGMRLFTPQQIEDWQKEGKIRPEKLHQAIKSQSMPQALFLLYLSGDKNVKETLWSLIIAKNNLVSEKIKRTAIASAASKAIGNNLIPAPGHYHQAGLNIAIDHCQHSWEDLLITYKNNQDVLTKIKDYRQELACAKRYRTFLFKYR